MNPGDSLRILPEIVLTLTGVLVMLLDASLPQAWPRRTLGMIAAIGTMVAIWASIGQLGLPTGTGFSGTVETSPFTVFFHVLICGVVLVALLLAVDTLPEDSHHQGEYYALVVFGAVGMCLMTSAVELLLVFVSLEISSIATYILAGYRKQTGQGPEAAIKYFLLGSFATAFLLYGIALVFGATGTTQIYEIAHALSSTSSEPLVVAALALMLVGILFKVSAAPFHLWTPDVYEGAPSPVVALLSTAPKVAAFALLLRVVYEIFPAERVLWAPLLWIVAPEGLPVGSKRTSNRRQRRIRGPARLRRAARNEKADEHHDAAHEIKLVAHHVDARKGHVGRADLERRHKIAKGAKRQRHNREEDHDRPMHRAVGIVEVGTDHAHGALGVLADHVRAVNLEKQVADEGHSLSGMADLPAHQQHEAEAEKHEKQRGDAVLNADDFVVGGKDVFPPKPQFVMRFVRVC